MLLGDSCYRSLVHNLTISDSVCMKLAVSKALSLAIVAASSVVKVPQMIKLINSGSAEGVSFIGYLLETASLMVTLVYNVRNKFPFSSFGETAFIVIQNVAICFLVLEYSGKGNMGSMLIAALAGIHYAKQCVIWKPAPHAHTRTHFGDLSIAPHADVLLQRSSN